MWWLIIIIAILLVLLFSMRLRIRLVLNHDRKILFFGLGRSGPEYDFVTRRFHLKFMGIKLFSFSKSEGGDDTPEDVKPTGATKPEGKKRGGSIVNYLRLTPSVMDALWTYLSKMLKAMIVEELEASVEGGFESPDLTGRVYGYYLATVGAVPSLRKFQYVPVWNEAGFSGTARVTVALPVYKASFRTLQLAWQLPVVDIIKLARQKRKGVSKDE